MRAQTRREEWAAVDVDDLPVPAATLHKTPVGAATRRLADTAHDAYRLAADHADAAASVNPRAATPRQIGGLRIARSRAEAAVDKARAAQRALGADLTGKPGAKWAAEIGRSRTVAARRVDVAVRQVATAASGFDAVDRAQAWRDSATTAHLTGARWPVGFSAPPRSVVLGSRRYPLDTVLAAITDAFNIDQKEAPCLT